MPNAQSILDEIRNLAAVSVADVAGDPADTIVAAAADPEGPNFIILSGVAAGLIDAADFQF